MILVHAVFFISVLGVGPGSGSALAPGSLAAPDSAAAARRIAAAADLAAQEYRFGVVDGKVVKPEEVAEARLFLTEARRAAALLPKVAADAAIAGLDSALTLVDATAHPDSIATVVRAIHQRLESSLGLILVEIPSQPPSLLHGREIFVRECASCHGAGGRGDGSAGIGLDPPPANLADRSALADATPLSFYQRVTIGVAGTAMPAYEGRLPAADRWAVALYATTLREDSLSGTAAIPASLQDFGTTARMNDAEILAALGTAGGGTDVAAVRMYQPGSDQAGRAAVFSKVRDQIDAAGKLARKGDHDAAVTAAFDAYLTFEQVEKAVGAKDPSLSTDLEGAFATLRTRVAGGATPEELGAVRDELYAGLERAERVVADKTSAANLFLQSLMILLREGLEAILIIGALMTFLTRIGAGHRKRDIHIGVGAAVALSVLTAVLLETVFQLSPAHREVLEAATMLVAVAVLFYVSYWLLSKMEVQKWTAFVKSRVQVAVTGGSAFALASAAFLAVYREGFETVLFYNALLFSGGSTGSTVLPVGLGIAVGGVALAVVYLLINRYGVKLPLRPFFGATSAFLYYTAFVFAGKGVAELQAGGVVGTTVLPGWPRVATLGIYPTVESMLAQGILVVLALFALGWIFLRKKETVAAEPEATSAVREVAPSPVGVEAVVLRSLEQMEADLAALRAEVERLRDSVAGATADGVAGRAK